MRTPSYDSKCGEFQGKFWERQWVFPDGSAGEESICHRRHRRYGFHHRVGKIPGGGNGSPLQYSGLKNPMNGGAWQATVQQFAESDMIERLRTQACGLMSDRQGARGAVLALPFPVR